MELILACDLVEALYHYNLCFGKSMTVCYWYIPHGSGLVCGECRGIVLNLLEPGARGQLLIKLPLCRFRRTVKSSETLLLTLK